MVKHKHKLMKINGDVKTSESKRLCVLFRQALKKKVQIVIGVKRLPKETKGKTYFTFNITELERTLKIAKKRDLIILDMLTKKDVNLIMKGQKKIMS